jgi:hypothetical protein
MVNSTSNGFEDEEKTLPPLLDDDLDRRPRVPAVPSASGAFKTHKTTLAVRVGEVVEVRLGSAQGYVAHFGFDKDVAASVARALAPEIAHAANGRFPSPPPPPVRTAWIFPELTCSSRSRSIQGSTSRSNRAVTVFVSWS